MGEGRGAGPGAGAEAAGSAIGVLACSGKLPLELAQAARAAGRTVEIVAIEGSADPRVDAFPHTWVSLGQLGRILKTFRRAGCRELIIAGGIERPDFRRLKFDAGLLRHLPVVLSLSRGGDDRVLRRVVQFFEAQGFLVRGVGEIAPSLLAPAGVLGVCRPDGDAQAAIATAQRLMQVLGTFDVGQAVVATRDRIIAVEGVRGTDAMLGDLAAGGPGAGLGRGGVLVKLVKPGQELRVDLPAVGSTTIERAAAAGLAGIAVGAGEAVILERPALRSRADAAGLFVIGLETGAGNASGLVEIEAGLTAEAPLLEVLSRRAPTPAERRDIGIARRLMPVVTAHGAGRFAVVAAEHVLGLSGALPVAAMIAPLSGRGHWGFGAWRKRIGVLAIDIAEGARGAPDAGPMLSPDLFRAVVDARLAGIVCLGAALPEAVRTECVAWANEAKVFLMAEAPR